MSTSLLTTRQEFARQLGVAKLIPIAKLDSIAASSITSADILRDASAGPGDFKGKKTNIFRPIAASSADYSRPAALLATTTGALSHGGANYADTTSTNEYVELWYWGVRPDLEFIDCLNRVLEFEYVTTMFAISHLSQLDGDMALSTDTNWTDIGTLGTSAKSTTSPFVPFGQRSYHTINNASASAGTRSASYAVRATGPVSAYAIATTLVGTSSLQLYNNTGSAVFSNNTAVTSDSREPQLLAQRGIEVPSGVALASLNLTNTNASGDTYWNQAWLYNHEELTMFLPSVINEGFMAPRILQGIPRVGTGTNTYAARSMDFEPLIEGRDYWLIINHADGEPYKVRFRDSSFYNYPLFVEARIPQSGRVTMAADEAAVFEVAKHNVLPRLKMDALRTIYNGAAAPRHPDWANQMQLAQNQLIAAQAARPVASIAKPQPFRIGVTRL